MRCLMLGRDLDRATTTSVTPGWWPPQYHGWGTRMGVQPTLHGGKKSQELQLQVPSPCTTQGLFLGS